jgi:hypothetical protein
MAAYPLKYTRQVARRAAAAYYWKRFTMPFWRLWLSGIAGGVAIIAFWPRDDFGRYLIGAVGFLTVVSAALVVTRYTALQRQADTLPDRFEANPATVSVSTEGLRLTQGENAATYPWSNIERIWPGDGFVVLAFNPFIFVHVPTEGLPLAVVQRLANRGVGQPET